jgi:hypothetical protein
MQLAPVVAAAVFAMSGTVANAGIYESYLEYSAVGAFGGNLTSNTAPYFGEVTLTEGGSGQGAYVDVHVELFNGFKFIDSGNDATHTSFAFNLTAPGIAHVTNIAPSPPWTLNATNPSSNNPFGSYTTGLDCCASNGAPGISGPLDFRVTSDNGITFLGAGGYVNDVDGYVTGTGDRFASNTTGSFGPYTGGWWFSADLIGPDGVTTGPVAARYGTVGTIPEPATYAMLLASLGIMGFMQRRARRTSMLDS